MMNTWRKWMSLFARGWKDKRIERMVNYRGLDCCQYKISKKEASSPQERADINPNLWP